MPTITQSSRLGMGFALDKAPLTDISRCPRNRRQSQRFPAARNEKKRRALLTKKPPYESEPHKGTPRIGSGTAGNPNLARTKTRPRPVFGTRGRTRTPNAAVPAIGGVRPGS